MGVNVDLPFFFILFAFTFSDPVTVHFLVYRTCYITLGFNESDCALLGTANATNETAKLEQEVQPHVAVLTTTKFVIEILVTTILCFFLGSWSDQYGRKPVMVMALTGYLISYCIITVISFFGNVSPWFVLLSTIPICLTGGFPSFLSVSICYLTEKTSLANRGFRMGIFETTITIAGLLGTTCSSFAFLAFGYVPVYCITTVSIFMAWFVVLTCLSESLTNVQTEDRLKNLFKISLLVDTVKTTFKRRQHKDRALLLTVVLVTVVFLLAVTADGNLVFLYLRRKLRWTLKQYTLFGTCKKLSWMTGSIVGGLFLHKYLHIEESIIMLLGFFSVMANVFIQGIATKDWHMYIAAGTICFGGSISPMTRSLISKLVSVEEYGKVFSFVILTETVVDLMGSPLYAYIYRNTLVSLPGAFNFVTTGIYGFEVLLTLCVIVMQLRRSETGYVSLAEVPIAET